MRVDVIMPQMGESIAEGTITRWLKKPGERVARDEPLFEISTDKVDAEIPSPAEGTLVAIRHAEGETVAVNEVVGVLDTAGDAKVEETPAAGAGGPSPPKETPAVAEAAGASAAEPAGTEEVPPTPAAPARPSKTFVSPVVRRIAAEHGVDPSVVPGTGAGGRVTRKDIERFLAAGGAAAPPGAAPPAAGRPEAPSFPPGSREHRVSMSAMRRKIAEHMVQSRRVSAHVHTVFEVDMSRVLALRDRYKQKYLDRHGTRLTMTPFFVKAVCDGLRGWPILNSSVDGEEIVYRKDLNIGVAVALDWGLIVPVIRNADELTVAGLARRINDLADRARARKLTPDEVQGGTFTITNPGIYGGLFGLPIIHQPQVGILGVGGIRKRAVVVDDAIAIRPMVYLALSFDHRVVDGAVADQFMGVVKEGLERFDESLL